MFYVISRAFVFFVCLSSVAFAAPSSLTGERNFERALRAEWANRNQEKASEYYARAAEALEALMNEKGADTRVSYLVMAGISQFKIGKHAEAARTLKMVAAYDARIWEAWVYGGLAHAMTGDAEGALNMWRRFPVSSSQRELSTVLATQVRELGAENTTLQQAAQAILEAEGRQFRWNYYGPRNRRGISPQEYCSGRFWWRYYHTQCEVRLLD